MSIFNHLFDALVKSAEERVDNYKKSGARFVHYTSCDAAFKIISTNTVWLRNIALMNDYSEVRLGSQVWSNTFNGPEGLKIIEIINQTHPRLWKEIIDSLVSIESASIANTYAISVSEFPPEDQSHEATHGRLSMWRAYAQRNGAAIIMKSDSFAHEAEQPHLLATPMRYFGANDILSEVKEILAIMDGNYNELRNLHPSHVKTFFEHWFVWTLLSCKHKAFEEEREWRVGWNAFLSKDIDSSSMKSGLHFDYFSLFGVPQKILVVDLSKYGETESQGSHPRNLLSEILIGPSDFPQTLQDSIEAALLKTGLSETVRVKITGIPLRLSNN